MSLKAEEHAQCKALTPRQELVRGPNWIKTHIGSRHKRVGGFWPPNPEETSADGTPESGPISLKGFPRTENEGLCVRVCVSWVFMYHVSWILKHLANGECRWPHWINSQSPSKVSPEVAAAPRGVCPSKRSFYHPTLQSMTEAGIPQLPHLCTSQASEIHCRHVCPKADHTSLYGGYVSSALSNMPFEAL